MKEKNGKREGRKRGQSFRPRTIDPGDTRRIAGGIVSVEKRSRGGGKERESGRLGGHHWAKTLGAGGSLNCLGEKEESG